METNEEVMGKQKAKTSKGIIAALIIVILLLLGAVGYIVYDKVFANQTKTNENQVTNTVTNTESNETNVNTVENTTETKVPMADLTSYIIEPGSIWIQYVEDGYIYSYSSSDYLLKENEVYTKEFIDYDGVDSHEYTMKKYEALSNVKRIKTFNSGSSIKPFIYAITEDGKVYYPYYYYENGKEAPKQEMELSAYKVDDILDYQSSELGTTWKIKLQDGTTKTIEERSSAYNEIMEETRAQQ